MLSKICFCHAWQWNSWLARQVDKEMNMTVYTNPYVIDLGKKKSTTASLNLTDSILITVIWVLTIGQLKASIQQHTVLCGKACANNLPIVDGQLLIKTKPLPFPLLWWQAHGTEGEHFKPHSQNTSTMHLQSYSFTNRLMTNNPYLHMISFQVFTQMMVHYCMPFDNELLVILMHLTTVTLQ